MKKYIKQNAGYLCLVVIFAFLECGAAVGVQFLKGEALDMAIAKNLKSLWMFGGLFIGLVIVEILCYYIYSQFRMKYAMNCSKLLRRDYFKSLLGRKISDFDLDHTSGYVTKFSNDLELLKNMYFINMTLLLNLVVKVVLVSVGLFMLNWKIALITLVLLTMPLYVPKLVEKKLMNTENAYVKSMETFLAKTTDWINKYEVLKLFNIEHRILKQFDEENEELTKKTLEDKTMNNVSTVLSALMSYFSHVIILLVAIAFVYWNEFTPGMCLVAVGMIDQLSYPIISVATSIQNLLSVKDVKKKILNEINAYPLAESQGPLSLTTAIEGKGVTFGYPEKENLWSGLNFYFEKGKKYLVKGESGKGKTTLLNLLMGYYPLRGGSILVDGKDVRQTETYRMITLIRQTPYLFTDTLKNNVTLYQNYDDEEVKNVLDSLNLSKYSSTLDTFLGENGSKISGGEAKRVCVARGLLSQKDVLIFDEPTANLDNDTAMKVMNTILSVEGKTVLVVSHTVTKEDEQRFDGIFDMAVL